MYEVALCSVVVGSIIFLNVHNIIASCSSNTLLYAGSMIWCPLFLNVEEGDSGSTITCNRSLASFQSLVRVSSEDGTANG